MGDKPNPFDRKIKKSKLKAFGSGKRKGGVAKTSPPKRATPPARVVSKDDNPFQKKKRRRKQLAQELEATEQKIEQSMIDYEDAFALESKLFARLEKLKPGSPVYTTTQRKWSDAMREVERIQVRLLGSAAVARKIKEKL